MINATIFYTTIVPLIITCAYIVHLLSKRNLAVLIFISSIGAAIGSFFAILVNFLFGYAIDSTQYSNGIWGAFIGSLVFLYYSNHKSISHEKNKKVAFKIRILISILFLYIIGILFISIVNLKHIIDKKDKGEENIEAMFNHKILKKSCISANKEENELFRMTEALYKLSQETNQFISIKIGIDKSLAHGMYRREKQDYEPICPPPNFYNRIGSYITKNDDLSSKITGYELDLIAKIDNPTPYIIEKISEVAFKEQPHIEASIYKGKWVDLRPKARVILARNKTISRKYAEKAYQLISHKHPLGTTAAQIASSADYKDSLQQVENMINKILDDIPTDSPISPYEMQRIQELGYALILGGDRAKEHIAPLERVLNMSVIGFGGGILSPIVHRPKSICKIIDEIYIQNTITSNYYFCK